MAKAVTLKNNNDEEVYPVTDISLVNGELNGARIVNASVGSDKLTPNAVWEENIKDKAVTSAKINWTTFDENEWPAFTTVTKNNNVNSDYWYDQYSYTIPADGAYIANFSQQMTNGGDSNDFQVNLILGTKSLITLASGGSSWVNYIQASANASFVAKKGDILKARSKGGGSGSFSTRYGNISIARIR